MTSVQIGAKSHVQHRHIQLNRYKFSNISKNRKIIRKSITASKPQKRRIAIMCDMKKLTYTRALIRRTVNKLASFSSLLSFQRKYRAHTCTRDKKTAACAHAYTCHYIYLITCQRKQIISEKCPRLPLPRNPPRRAFSPPNRPIFAYFSRMTTPNSETSSTYSQ